MDVPTLLHRGWICAIVTCLLSVSTVQADDSWVVYDGTSGPGKGKHIVLVSGDEEYRSEETLPQLAKILARHHGFKCTVLFAIDPKDGTINPNVNNNIPGLEKLRDADLMVLFTRFRNLPDDQLKHLVDYIESGRPMVALRTATHAFALKKSDSFQKYDWRSKAWDGGFGRQVLGETWHSHHGKHGSQSTRGIIAPGMQTHPIARGIKDGNIWGPSDVYGVRLPLPGDSLPIVLGQVLEGMKPSDKPVATKQNEPMMPIAWTRSYTGTSGKTSRVFVTTMGASQDFASEGLRRLLVNACYWAVGLEQSIGGGSETVVSTHRYGLLRRRTRSTVHVIETPPANVEIVGAFNPQPFRVGGFIKGVKPADLK